MKLTNEIVFHHSGEWIEHGRDMYEIAPGDVLILDNGQEVLLSKESPDAFLDGIAKRMENDQITGIFINGSREAYIEFLKVSDCE